MTDPNAPNGQAGRRRSYQSIAAKLLIAFGLIAALTVGATLLSLISFNQTDAVMRRVTDESLPLVKLSLSVETKAGELVESASDLADSETGLDQFQRMERVSTQIAELWNLLGKLQSIGAEAGTIRQLQEIVGALSGEISAIDRTTRDFVHTLGQRNAAMGRIDGINRDLTLLISPVSYDFAARATAALDRGEHAKVEIDELRGSLFVLRSVYNMRADISQIIGLLARVVNAQDASVILSLRDQLNINIKYLRDNLESIEKLGDLDSGQRGQLRSAVDSLIALASGDDGITALQWLYLPQRRTLTDHQLNLRTISGHLRTHVSHLVEAAEREANSTTALSRRAVESSRFWLILIAVASLVIAGLIVWLFVLRYVAARLTELHDSMLAIADGELTAPIPEAKPDELGDMSRTLAVFRQNSLEIRAAKEEAERARAEAEAASRTKSSFLANMSHELRTPLNAIIGYSEILVEDANDRGDDTSVDDLQKIQGAGHHLLGLINGILDLSKIEAGRMDIYLEQIYLTKLADEVRTIVEPLVVKNGSKLVTVCAPDIGSIRTDMTKLKQALINLLSNAAKFTKDGTVTLTVSRDDSGNGPSRISFAVSDSGIGMTEVQLGRLFQAFTQADSSTTRNYGGTGLGLTITRHFATMLGGTIDVTSKPGEGSTFTMVLPDQPIQASGAAAGAAFSESGVATAGLTVLVVDDDPTVHDLLSATLSKEGYRILHARDGAEALEILRKTPPDIVTLDVMMPKIDGWSVLGIMKSDPALDHIPVIMITIVDDRNLGYTLGASEFMTKPIDRSRLLTLVRAFTAKISKPSVLIVDDDPEVRDLVSATLEGSGLKTMQAVNGRAAIDWLNSNPLPSLILLDLMMPVMDGFEFLEEIRKDDELIDVPVVVLTAKMLTDEERAFLAERTLLVLSKSAQPISQLGSALSVIAQQRIARATPADQLAAAQG
jgi:signal transduction histidine kinase/DNA-binding response OmpR family regulator